MIVYYAKIFEAARASGRIVPITCEKCRCEYFYELTRIGTGSGRAPFGARQEEAARKASDGANRDVVDRLRAEADLVPCPKCRWINEEMVRGYRRGKYRHLASYAIGFALLGSAASLILALSAALGPPRERLAVPFHLFGGPLICALAATVVILFGRWLRGRIRPNRDFPSPPRLPPGSPPALVVDPESGDLVVADPQWKAGGTDREWIEFQIGRNEIPPRCCECLCHTTFDHGYDPPVRAEVTIRIPRCVPCARRLRWKHLAIWFVTASVASLSVFGILSLPRLDKAVFWTFSIAGSALLCFIATGIAAAFTAPVKTKTGDASRGVCLLRFRNPEFAKLVVDHMNR